MRNACLARSLRDATRRGTAHIPGEHSRGTETMRGYLGLALIGIGLGILAFLGAVATIVGILKAIALVILVLACMAFRRKKNLRAQR